MTARGGMYPGPGGENLHGDGKPVGSPDENLETKIMLNIVDLAGQFAKTLNEVPVEHVGIILASVCGTIAENITHEMWKSVLAHKQEPCGDVGCECHIHLTRFLPELYNLKLAADEAQEKVRNKEGRGLN